MGRPRVQMQALLLALTLWAGPGHAAPAPPTSDVLKLPLPQLSGPMPVEQALQQRRSQREFTALPLRLEDVSQLLWAAQGVTHPRGYRTAPSAGALAPLEVYLVATQVTGLAGGVYHYQPQTHALLLVRSGDRRAQIAAAAHGQPAVRDAPALLVIAAVYQRTIARYGSRGERYVHIEAGHAAQNVYLQCTARDLATVLVGAFGDTALREALGLPADHVPLALMPIGHPR
ncbi:MAG TPA: SagB/ThcOx family dehydrogenase [Albitalea sp.]|nr:SagB/ThcOx family dehydrogenase [Albitalea sp.]